MIYIVSGIAFILFLVLCFVLGFWCHRQSRHKRIKRSVRSAREIIPLDKWELLPEEIKYEEELGRGAFGVVYKATLKRRVGIEVFDTEKTLKPEEPCQVVAVKELQGNCNHQAKSCTKGRIKLHNLLIG
ncbi:insulin-like peptide receptor isoform X1 [Orbicella faveolata]|uniref:insulin-like peptide receptor isoform X1 n=1 Tax=Orbicella faveolata TaxID=48498 RepID=UPI0009E2B1A7|nr:insulin-like peptide receptor isoform X1 [Orbicella faveolata]